MAINNVLCQSSDSSRTFAYDDNESSDGNLVIDDVENESSVNNEDNFGAEFNNAVNNKEGQGSKPSTTVNNQEILLVQLSNSVNNKESQASEPSMCVNNQEILLVQLSSGVNNKESQASEPSMSVNNQEICPFKLDISINNVVCKYHCGCLLNLREIAQNGLNVEYTRTHKLFMKLKNPYCTSRISSSGKVVCSGTKSKEEARLAARRTVKRLERLGFKATVTNFKIFNVFGSCSLPFGVKIEEFSKAHREAVYEPELHQGVTYTVREFPATLKIFSSGSITAISTSEGRVRAALKAVYPKILPYKFGVKRGVKGSKEPRQRTVGGPRFKKQKKSLKKTRQD